jgi:putative heme-binding domain-containing protein
MGRGGQALVAAISPLAGATNAPRNYAAEIAAIVNQIKLGADPADGELVYRKSGCALCHAIGGAGGKLGPDMSSIGASAPLDYIIESVLNPAAKVKEGYHAFAFTMKDGTVENGIPAGETATEIIIRPGPGFEKPLIKANILKRENIGSIMPAGLADGLEGVPRRNLFAFLGEIGRPGPFDASKGNVARLWSFHADQTSALSKDAAVQRAAQPTYTLVNGQLANEFFLGRTFATAKFTAAAPTAKPLVLTGVKAAWLDGTSVLLKDGQLTASIPAGNHSLTVEIDPSTRFLRAQCDDVSFLVD